MIQSKFVNVINFAMRNVLLNHIAMFKIWIKIWKYNVKVANK